MAEEKTAHVIWKKNALDFSGTVGSGYRYDFSGQSGPDTGASPMEFLVAGLAGCTAMDVISILEKKRQTVNSFEVKVRGVRAEDHPKVYTAVEVVYIVRGDDIDEKAVQRAIELSETRYCGAIGTFKLGNIPVTTSYEIIQAG